jgi:hypothetical protein
MLAARVKVLHEYVCGVEAQRIPYNHVLLRQIAAFLSQLPAVDTPDFEREFLAEMNDTLLLMQLCAMTSGVAQLQDLCDRITAVHGAPRSPSASRLTSCIPLIISLRRQTVRRGVVPEHGLSFDWCPGL